MPVEAGDNHRTQLRRRTEGDESLEVMMETIVTDPLSAEPTVMMSLIDLLMLNAIVCGLEFCASAAFCYIPPLLLKAGIRCVVFSVSDLYTVIASLVIQQFLSHDAVLLHFVCLTVVSVSNRQYTCTVS